ncbi:DNA-binding domain-containing protein [Catalinimonas sp. 4WD22]|uniref:DNA-binding domain-containing protein n=1 Tax=Catalinimonas locisalis TaxID=3133978 RepID=UPI0031011C71
MAAKYSLRDNKLTSDPLDCMAVIVGGNSMTESDIVEEMISGDSTITHPEAMAVLESYTRAIERLLEKGFSINTGLFNIVPSIKGVFTDEDDSFDPTRHKVRINVTTGVRLKKLPQRIKVVKVDPVEVLPKVRNYLDGSSGSKNGQITPGGIATLKGKRIKLDMAEPEQGVFLINATDSQEVRVDIVASNNPSELIFQNPQGLAAGEYWLEVRNKLNKTNEIRIGRMKHKLSVS